MTYSYQFTTPKNYGAVGDGIADDTQSFSLASVTGNTIKVPKGTYRICGDVSFFTSLDFDYGAVLLIEGTVVITGEVLAGNYKVFNVKPSGKIIGLTQAKVEWFGAAANGITDSYSAIQTMLRCGVKTVEYGAGTYYHSSTVQLYGNSQVTVRGAGFRNTSLTIGAASKALFKFERTLTSGGCVATFEDLVFHWTGNAMAPGSCAILFTGYADRYDDNWLRVYRCCFYWFENAVWTKWCGQSYFVDNFYQANKISHRMDRGSSFFYFRGCMSFDERFIYANDPAGDGYSNGLVVDNTNAFGSVGEAVFVQGWQSVYISKSGFDMGQSGQAAVWFKDCQDVSMDACFISSDPTVAPTRKGAIVDKCRSVFFRACSIVNNMVGVDVYSAEHNLASQVVIDGCKFGGPALNYVILRDGVEGCKVVNNHFELSCSRTGSNYEVYGPGSNNNICSGNTFYGNPYSIGLGPNSLVNNNLFNVKS